MADTIRRPPPGDGHEADRCAQLMKDYGQSAARWLHQRYKMCPADIDDTIQGAFIRYWSYGYASRPVKTPWLLFRKVLRSVAIDGIRSKASIPEIQMYAAGCASAIADCTSDPATSITPQCLIVQSIIAQMNDKDRDILLAYSANYPLTEIARYFEMTNGAVRQALHRAKRNLEAALAKEGFAESEGKICG